MEITQLFKACCKTVRLRSKFDKTSQQFVTTSSSSDKGKKQSAQTTNDSRRPPNKLREKYKNDPFIKKSSDLQFQLTQIKNFLIENRAAYMKFACHLKSATQMSDEERDLIDQETEKILSLCTEMINEMRGKRKTYSRQIDEHVDNVIEMLLNYLGRVNKIYTEQKEYRIKRDLENYSFLKLQSDKKKLEMTSNRISGELNGQHASDDDLPEEPMEQDDDETNLLEESAMSSFMDSEHDGLRHRKHGTSSLRNKYKLSLDDEISNSNLMYAGDVDDEISPEDIQMFESENIQLFNELKGVSEEVEQIEKNVVDIAKLQDIFSEKVTLQKHDIDRIANTVVGATEDIRDANEQIKQAIQRNAGLRVYILFFLIVMSFSLLFLDWYND